MHWMVASMVVVASMVGGCSFGPEQGTSITGTAGVTNTTDPKVLQEAHLSWMTGACFGFASWPLTIATRGFDHDQIVLDEVALGQSFEAVFTVEGPYEDLRVLFYDAEGGGAGDVTSTESTLSGVVPVDAHWAIFTSCGGTSVDVVFTVVPLETD
jgi:hypothetical protein